jgi:hypothetical protein
MLDAAASFPEYRLPELFAGFPRAPHEGLVPDPVACSPQAWAAGALPWMLISGLGLIPDGLARTLQIRRPLLPRHVGRLELQGLRVAGARVDLLFERVSERSDRVALSDAHVDGDLDVVLDGGSLRHEDDLAKEVAGGHRLEAAPRFAQRHDLVDRRPDTGLDEEAR